MIDNSHGQIANCKVELAGISTVRDKTVLSAGQHWQNCVAPGTRLFCVRPNLTPQVLTQTVGISPRHDT